MALRQTWRGCSSQREGQVQGPWGDAPGVQDKEAGEQSENESEGRDRAGGAWGHSSKRRRVRGGLTWSEVYKETNSCALQKTDSKWGRVKVDTSEDITGIS